MQNLADQHSRHAEIVGVLSAWPVVFSRRIHQRDRLSDDGELAHRVIRRRQTFSLRIDRSFIA